MHAHTITTTPEHAPPGIYTGHRIRVPARARPASCMYGSSRFDQTEAKPRIGPEIQPRIHKLPSRVFQKIIESMQFKVVK